MSSFGDDPTHPGFAPLALSAATPHVSEWEGFTEEILAARPHAPSGACVAWGLSFEVGELVPVASRAVALRCPPSRAACRLGALDELAVRLAEPASGLGHRGPALRASVGGAGAGGGERRVHNQLHALGYYHEHTATEGHKEHH